MIYRGNKKTNQNPTPNPSTEGNQLDVSQPRNSRFSNFSRENTLYKQCNPELRAPPYSCCVGNGGSPSSSLVIKTLAFALDTGSLVVIGRFRDLGITMRGGLSLGSGGSGAPGCRGRTRRGGARTRGERPGGAGTRCGPRGSERGVKE